MLYTAFILGLLGSFHCLGMCGPIAFMLPIGTAKGVKKAILISLYHTGRIGTYAILGAIFGTLGKGMALFGMQQKISIAIGILMLAAVLFPILWSAYTPWGNIISKTYHRWIFKVQSSLGKALRKGDRDHFITIGFLNGFLPCGLVSMALLGAVASGSSQAYQGALYMVFFGLGTVPMMSAAIYASQFLKEVQLQRIKKLIPIFIGIIGLWFILRGMGLGIPYLSPKTNLMAGNSSIECHDPSLGD